MIRHFNRRALLLGGTATGGALMLRDEPFSPVICGPGTLISSARAQPVTPRVRPSLATPEGKQMLALYGKAIGRMKQLPRHDPRNWYFQANIHGYPEGRPVKSGFISSYFGEREDPFSGEEAYHKGVDFAGTAGRADRRPQMRRGNGLAVLEQLIFIVFV